MVEENKPKEEGQPPKKDEEKKTTSAGDSSKNMLVPVRRGPIASFFGGMRNFISRIKNKILKKSEKQVQEPITIEQDEEESSIGDSSTEQKSDMTKVQTSLDEQLRIGVDQSKFNKPIQPKVVSAKEDEQKTNDGEEFEQGE